jgi:REP element-mobilizing transposase RayT
VFGQVSEILVFGHAMTLPIRSRGYLPHLERQDPIYFVTFRLADSLPRKILEELRTERQAIEKASRAHTAVLADQTRAEKLRKTIQKAERVLDGAHGDCFMHDHRVARIVADAIQFFDGKRYRLLAWCVMPNHVHVVFSPIADRKLSEILHSWKSFSAEKANALLQRSGRFWQREYFDHLVRSEASLEKIIDYVKRNPEKAGLKDWPWAGFMS